MAEAAEQIEIALDDPVPAKKHPEIEVVKAEETSQKTKEKIMEPEEGLEVLKKKLEQEKADKLAAESRAKSAEARAKTAEETVVKAKNDVQDTNLHLITNAIETVKQSNEVLKANYSAAMAASDFDKAGEVQFQMSTNAAKLLQLEQGKKALEEQPKQKIQPRQQSADPVEALATQLTPRSASWVRAHPECATNPRLYSKMLGAHNIAVSDDIKPDSDEYFEKIESLMGFTEPVETGVEDPTELAAKPTQRRVAPPAAPVTRSGNGAGRPTIVRLTAAEREMAQMMQMTDEEYAKNKVALQKDGRMN